VKLLRVTSARVFFAPDTIGPGEQWEPLLRRAVERCRSIVVFWCAHSEASAWVQIEYRLAISL